MRFKVQAGHWPKWDGEGEPTGPVFWEDWDGTYPTNEAARAALVRDCADFGGDPDRHRVTIATD